MSYFCNGYFKDSTCFFQKYMAGTGWDPQNSVQLPYKWLNNGFGTVDITIVNGHVHGLYKPANITAAHHPGAPFFSAGNCQDIESKVLHSSGSVFAEAGPKPKLNWGTYRLQNM